MTVFSQPIAVPAIRPSYGYDVQQSISPPLWPSWQTQPPPQNSPPFWMTSSPQIPSHPNPNFILPPQQGQGWIPMQHSPISLSPQGPSFFQFPPSQETIAYLQQHSGTPNGLLQPTGTPSPPPNYDYNSIYQSQSSSQNESQQPFPRSDAPVYNYNQPSNGNWCTNPSMICNYGCSPPIVMLPQQVSPPFMLHEFPSPPPPQYQQHAGPENGKTGKTTGNPASVSPRMTQVNNKYSVKRSSETPTQGLVAAKFCGFCKSNKETRKFFTSHYLKSKAGIVTCPILRNYTCPICNATGENSHTLKYCPENRGEKRVESYLSHLDTGRNARGRIGSYHYD